MSVSESIGVPSGQSLPGPGPGVWLRRWQRSWASRPLSERVAWAGLAGLLVCTAVITVSAAQTDLLLPQTVRPVLPSLAGAFGQHGINLGFGGLTAVLTLMFAAYIAVLRGAVALPARAILIGIAAMHALVLLAPPLLSTDVFSYIAYGRIDRVYAANPYLFGPSVMGHFDALYPYIDAQWVTTPTAYGPLFTALSYVLSPLTIAGNVLAYKAIAATGSLLVVLMVWKASALRGVNPVKAVALVGLNPVTVVYGVGGGHNDMLMLAILITGVYVLLQDRERTGGVMIVVATAVKLTGGLLAPFALARHGGGSTGRRSLLGGLTLAAMIATAFSFGLFGTGPLHLLGTLHSVQGEGGIHSVPGLVLGGLGLTSLSGPVGAVLDLAFLLTVCWLVREVWRGEMDWIVAAGWATVGLLVSAGLLLPWYVAWLMPLAALSHDRRLLIAAVLLTGLGLTTL